MLTVAAVLCAFLNFEAACFGSVAVAAARTASAAIVNPESESAKRTGTFGYVTYRAVR